MILNHPPIDPSVFSFINTSSNNSNSSTNNSSANTNIDMDLNELAWNNVNVPPPVSSTTVNSDSLNLNGEIFFNQNNQLTNADIDALTADLNSSSSSTSLPNTYLDLNTSITTPEFPSPNKVSYHYAYNERPNIRHSHSSSFSLPIDQLNLLTLKPFLSYSSKSPSPDEQPQADSTPARPTKATNHRQSKSQDFDFSNATINPRQLFTESIPELESSKTNNEILPQSIAINSNSGGYVLPSSVSSPSLSTLFKQVNKPAPPIRSNRPSGKSRSISLSSGVNQQPNPHDEKFDFVMNDECFNAISYWLNNTSEVVNKEEIPPIQQEELLAEILTNPTGMVKNSQFKRRNSIQVLSQPIQQSLDYDINNSITYNSAGQKRKRRKSFNYEMMVPPPLIHRGSSTTNTPLSSANSTTSLSSLLPNSPNKDVHWSNSPSILQNQKFDHIPTSLTENIKEEQEVKHDDDDDSPKPFPCADCTKVFKRSEHLKRHIRSVHSNIRPFHCKYCEKKFSRSDNLAQHLKTHYKTDEFGNTTIIYGNPNINGRGGRRKSKPT